MVNTEIPQNPVALFPGQGSQHIGMGKTLFDDFAIVRQIFEESSDATKKNIKKLCFDGPESDLTLTENTQPCLLTVSIAAFRVAQKEMGFQPSAVAGHSLGEYSALVAAGALSLETAVRWVQSRGIAMQKAVPAGEGKMAAILGLDDGAVSDLCKRATEAAIAARTQNPDSPSSALSVEAIVEPANFNAPGQTVIAGSADAVEEALRLAKGILLPVSAPFHCRLMRPARLKMAEVFEQTPTDQKPKSLNCPYVPNRTARLTTEHGLILEFLIDQIDHPVLWKQSIEALIHSGKNRAVEFGPGKVLQGLGKRIAKPLNASFEVLSVGDSESLKGLLK